MDDVQAQIEQVQAALAEGLKGWIGTAPDPEVVRHAIVEQLQTGCLAFPARVSSDWIEALADILVIDWVGIPEAFDPKATLARVPTDVLDRFVAGLSGEVGGAAGLVFLEWQERHGHILGWSVERVDQYTCKTIVQLKEPINHITTTFTIDKEDK